MFKWVLESSGCDRHAEMSHVYRDSEGRRRDPGAWGVQVFFRVLKITLGYLRICVPGSALDRLVHKRHRRSDRRGELSGDEW